MDSLRKLQTSYNLYIFSKLSREVGLSILKILDPKLTIFSGCFFNDHCLKTKKGRIIKDLRIFHQPLENMIIVDSRVQSFAYHLDNGICLAPWKNEEDSELKFLTDFLMGIHLCSDVRIEIAKRIGLSKIDDE